MVPLFAPDRHAFSNATTWSICTADEVRTPRTKWIVLPVYGSDSVPDSLAAGAGPGTRIRARTRTRYVAHVGQVARQHVFAHVASVAVVIGLAETE